MFHQPLSLSLISNQKNNGSLIFLNLIFCTSTSTCTRGAWTTNWVIRTPKSILVCLSLGVGDGALSSEQFILGNSIVRSRRNVVTLLSLTTQNSDLLLLGCRGFRHIVYRWQIHPATTQQRSTRHAPDLNPNWQYLFVNLKWCIWNTPFI